MNDFDTLVSHASEIRKIATYQRIEGKRRGIFGQTIPLIPWFSDCNLVLDLGCCNGVHSIVAAKHVPKVIGVENDIDYPSCSILRQYFRDHVSGYDDNGRLSFLNCSIKDMPDSAKQADGILAFNVLYHLDKANLQVVRDMMSTVKKIIVQCRMKVNNPANNLHLPDKVIPFLQGFGFEIKTRYGKTSRPVILGWK